MEFCMLVILQRRISYKRSDELYNIYNDVKLQSSAYQSSDPTLAGTPSPYGKWISQKHYRAKQRNEKDYLKSSRVIFRQEEITIITIKPECIGGVVLFKYIQPLYNSLELFINTAIDSRYLFATEMKISRI